MSRNKKRKKKGKENTQERKYVPEDFFQSFFRGIHPRS